MLLAEERVADALDHAVIVGLSRRDQLGVHLAVARRHAVVGGALKHGELLGLLRDFSDGLHPGGSGADYRHALGGEINAGLREAAGVVPLALEILQALELRNVGVERVPTAAMRKRAVTSSPLSVCTVHRVGALIEFGAGYPRVKLHVALQVMTFSDMLKIAQDLRLLRIAFGPFPLLKQLFVPGEAIDVGLGIATRAGVTVPVPGAANSFTGFVNSYLQSEFVP